jgi:GMP synthase-like glutamine amidotransferase
MDAADRLLVVEHERTAPAGLLGSWAARRGLAVDTARPAEGDVRPAGLSGYAGIAVLGSEQTAFDDALPWLADELALVTRAVDDGVPVLGICFGGQVLARVLGARVYRLTQPEIGWVRITSQHPSLASGPWLSWHQDGFGLPAGAAELAAGGTSVQAFALGPHVGLQFHPEATEPITADWLRAASAPLSAAHAARLSQGWAEAAGRVPDEAAALFSAWLDGALAGPAAAAWNTQRLRG